MNSTTRNTAPDAAATPARNNDFRGARTGTVVWGFIIMGIAALVFATTQWDLSVYHPAVIAAWTVVGFGALAIVGGLIAAIFRKR